MMYVFLLVLSVGAFVCDAKRVRAGGVPLGTNPGCIMEIRRSAVDSFIDNSGNLGVKYANKCPLPEINATVSGIDIMMKSPKIKDFGKPQISYRLIADNKITGCVKLPLVIFEAPFTAVRRTVWKTQSDGGVMTFTVNDAEACFELTIGTFENGVPKVDSFTCKATLGPASLNVKSCKERYAIDVMSTAAKAFRPGFLTTVCPVAEKMMSGQVNRLLSKIPNVIGNENYALKWQVVPTIAEDSVKISLFGRLLSGEVSPFQPAPFVVTRCDEAMFVALVSDAPFNDAAFQGFANKKFEFTVDKTSPPLVYSVCALKCNEGEICLGKVAPDLATKYGDDAFVKASFKALKAPEVEFMQDKATFKGSLSMTLEITRTSEPDKPQHEATASVEVSGSLQVRIQGQDPPTLFAKINVTTVTVHIDEEHNKKWEDKITEVIKKAVEEHCNNNLLKGLPLRLPFGFGVNEPMCKFAPHTMQCCAAFEYRAKSSSEASKEN